MTPDLRTILKDRNNDGVNDYIEARVFVPDQPTTAELAAASNIAARLAFETVSLNLPIGYPMSAYSASKTGISIVVGQAAAGIDDTNTVGFADLDAAARFATTVGLDGYTPQVPSSSPAKAIVSSLTNFFADGRRIYLGPDIGCIEVIDLAARLAMESTELRLPLVVAHVPDPLPPNAIVIQMNSRKENSQSGYGQIRTDRETGITYISGEDADGLREAIRHAAERLPNVWDYGKQHRRLSTIEDDLRRFFSLRSSPGLAVAALLESNERFAEFMAEPPVVFEDIYELHWEVDDGVRRIVETVLPHIDRSASVELDLRLGESPETRQRLQSRILQLLLNAGADPDRTTVRVLCAHKQGYSWIVEELAPRLQGAAIIRIRFRTVQPSENSVDSPIRWLQELYPVDEVLSQMLGLPLDKISFEQSADSPHTYEVLAEDKAGKPILHAFFDCRFADRPLLDTFPEYAQAMVSTGWLTASVNGEVVADTRIKTDPERFWDIFQSDILGQIRDYVLRLYGGKPHPECSPHFEEFTVEVALSEPDYRIGIDEERISTLEALHEDIYYTTLLFFDVLGTTSCGERLTYPGKIIPVVLPAREGPGHARFRFTGRNHPLAAQPSDAIPVSITGVTVRANFSGVVSLQASVGVDEHQGTRMVEGIREVHRRRSGSSWLQYEKVGEIRLVFLDTDEEFVLPQSVPRDLTPYPEIHGRAASPPIVKWDEPISPDECEAIIQQLACFPAVNAYFAGTSYGGRRIWAMDLVPPSGSRYFSEKKCRALKPVLLITGRQHANEVSSTSHILRLVELLVTDPRYAELLQKVCFVIHPITNPDGAALVAELHRLTPDFMLHACYLGALGMDVTHQQWNDAPKYPEARIRADLWRAWQPDMVLNPHGYPSHEWVQLFAGYSAWVRSRTAIARDWWIPRGWFLPHLEYVESDRDVVFDLLERTSIAMNATIGSLNQRMCARYARYGAFLPDSYKMSFHQELLVYTTEKTPDDYTSITMLDIVSEAPDEVAHGAWLNLVSTAGLEFSLLCARFLAEKAPPTIRTFNKDADGVVLRLTRQRNSR